MFTRQSRVIIDFDEASKAWNSNKKKLDNGCYQYICGALTKKGNTCKNKPLTGHNFCAIHQEMKIRSKL